MRFYTKPLGITLGILQMGSPKLMSCEAGKAFMADEYFNKSTRGPLDNIHFALAFVGFLVGVGGVIIASVFVAICGLMVLLWGLAYFAAN